MTILDYIAANPGCSGGEIAAALSYADSGVTAWSSEKSAKQAVGSLAR